MLVKESKDSDYLLVWRWEDQSCQTGPQPCWRGCSLPNLRKERFLGSERFTMMIILRLWSSSPKSHRKTTQKERLKVYIRHNPSRPFGFGVEFLDPSKRERRDAGKLFSILSRPQVRNCQFIYDIRLCAQNWELLTNLEQSVCKLSFDVRAQLQPLSEIHTQWHHLGHFNTER